MYSYIKGTVEEINLDYIVTANPETFMKADAISEFDKALINPKTTIVPDGIGVVKAANYIGISEMKETHFWKPFSKAS